MPVRSIRLQTGIAATLVLHSTLSDIRYQTHEQSGGIAPVNRAIADMDGMTQQNAELVERAGNQNSADAAVSNLHSIQMSQPAAGIRMLNLVEQ